MKSLFSNKRIKIITCATLLLFFIIALYIALSSIETKTNTPTEVITKSTEEITETTTESTTQTVETTTKKASSTTIKASETTTKYVPKETTTKKAETTTKPVVTTASNSTTVGEITPTPEQLENHKYCGDCGKVRGYGDNGTCAKFTYDMNCPKCGAFCNAHTCHTCK